MMREKIYDFSAAGSLISMLSVLVSVGFRYPYLTFFFLCVFTVSGLAYAFSDHPCFRQTILEVNGEMVYFPKIFFRQLHDKFKGFTFESVKKENYNRYVSVIRYRGKRMQVTQEL